MKLNHQLGKQKFTGQMLADKMIKDMMKGTVFATNRLISKDTKQKKGVIETTVVFYPFADTGGIDAQCVSGFKTEVDLPYTAKSCQVFSIEDVPVQAQIEESTIMGTYRGECL